LAPNQLPVQVVNRFSLIASSVNYDGVVQTVGSLACTGNGNAAVPQPLFLGVEQLVIRYGTVPVDTLPSGAVNTLATPPQTGSFVSDPAATSLTYRTATQVSAQPTMQEALFGVATIVDDFSPWRRVGAVQVCLLVRTQANTRNDNVLTAANAATTLDCNGAAVPSAGAGWIQRTFVGTVPLRNRMTRTDYVK
jgi:Type IV Pilus-assembly protein W